MVHGGLLGRLTVSAWLHIKLFVRTIDAGELMVVLDQLVDFYQVGGGSYGAALCGYSVEQGRMEQPRAANHMEQFYGANLRRNLTQKSYRADLWSSPVEQACGQRLSRSLSRPIERPIEKTIEQACGQRRAWGGLGPSSVSGAFGRVHRLG